MNKFICSGFIVLMFIFTACQSTPAAQADTGAAAELRNTLWKLTVLDGATVQTGQAQRMASLTLTSEASNARIVTACNGGSAGFSLNGSSLKFSPAISTKMACPPAQMKQEAAFFNAIENTASYKITGEVLELFDSGNKLLATFHSEYL